SPAPFSVARELTDRAHLSDADRVPQRRAAVAVGGADGANTGVAARRELGAGAAVRVRTAAPATTAAATAATARGARALAADRLDLPHADRIPGVAAAVAVGAADLRHARVAAGGERAPGGAHAVGAGVTGAAIGA